MLALLTVWSTAADVRYLRKGGVRPVFRVWVSFLMMVLLLPFATLFSVSVKDYPVVSLEDEAKFVAAVIWPVWDLTWWRVHPHPLRPRT
jgi:hypothetical protein